MNTANPFVFRLFYFSYFSCLGIYLPYFNLYLADLQFTGWQIGFIAAIPPFLKIFSTTLWGLCSDRWNARKHLTIIGCFFSVLAFSFFVWVDRFWDFVSVMFAFALFWTPTLPLVEATTLEVVEKREWDYGKIRLWGSVGFILLSAGFGFILDRTTPHAVIFGMLAFLILNLISAIRFPFPALPAQDPKIKLFGFIKKPEVMIFMACCLLMQASHGTYYGFFSISLEQIGYSKAMIGFLWAEGVVAEIVILVFAGRLMAKLGTLPLMTLSLLLAALRWSICALTVSFIPLLVAQLLHAFSFGLFHVAAVLQIHQMVPKPLRASGQSLYSSISYGIGMGSGLLLNGLLFNSLGPFPLFAISGGMAFAAGVLILFLNPIPPEPVGEGNL